MSEKKYILVSMEDEKINHLADVLGNKTSKKIIDLLAGKDEASEKDIADFLGIPINTVEYNLKKLLKAELIEKTKNFFWSRKGKKIDMYKLSNKSIIISTKSSRISSKLKSLLPVAILSGLGAVAIKFFIQTKSFSENIQDKAMASSLESLEILQTNFNSSIWLWFLSGALLAIIIFAILNWRKL